MQASKPRGGTNSRSRPPVTLGADGRREARGDWQGSGAQQRLPAEVRFTNDDWAALSDRTEGAIPGGRPARPPSSSPPSCLLFATPVHSSLWQRTRASRHSLDGIVPAHATSDGQSGTSPVPMQSLLHVMWPLSCSNPYPMQSLCTLRNHCRQWPRNTRYQADATPYLGFHGQDRTSAGGALNAAGDAAGGAVLGADCALLYSGSPCRRGRSRTRSKPLPGRTD